MKILLAEDDQHIVIVLTMSLTRLCNHVVVHAADGQAALDQALSEKFDLILLDSMMPKKDGIRVCQELKTQHSLETPIIFLSAKSQESDIREGLQMGAIGYIQKPFDPKTICQQIDEIMDHAALEKAA